MRWLEQAFERALWSSRFIVLLAVIASLLGMFVLFFMAYENMVFLAYEFVKGTIEGNLAKGFHAEAVAKIISAMDDFLLATVLLIFALGLYELFISEIDVARSDRRSSNILMIRSLDDLKDRLAKVVLMILVVAFFKNVLHVKFDDPLTILYMGGGILLVSLATYFSHKAGASHPPAKPNEKPDDRQEGH